MSPTFQTLGIDRMPPAERLRLAEEIWDSLTDDQLGEIPESHQRELDRRLEARLADPSATPWAEVRARLRGGK